MPIPVHLARCAGYDHPDLPGTVAGLLGRVLPQGLAGVRVLVKPNLVGPRTIALATTHPSVVRAVCLALLEKGAEVRVGDSPAFGTARSMARLTGLSRALAGLPVAVVNLGRPRPLQLSFGATIGLSADACEAGLIVNLPKLKAHSQMRVTGAVKNLFGCVVGFRKALAHARHGDHGCRFASLILEVAAALPQTVSLVDGVTAMHESGPTGGKPYALGLLGASAVSQALDTALWTLLNLTPQVVPLWRAAATRGLPGADPAELAYPGLCPADFPAAGFVVPARLKAETFDPYRLIRGRLKSLCAGLGLGRAD